MEGLISLSSFNSKQPGFDESEQREFNKALKQNLLVQTPLQVLLENMFNRLQSQAQMFHDLQDRVDLLESKELGARETALRVQLCEGRVADLTAAQQPLAKQQQEALARLDALEQSVHEGAERGAEQSEALTHLVSGLETRVSHVEGSVHHAGGESGFGEHEDGDDDDGRMSARSEQHGGGSQPGTPRSARSSRATTAASTAKNTKLMVVGHKQLTGGPGGDMYTSSDGPHLSHQALAELQAKVQKLSDDNKTLTAAVESCTSSISQMQATIDELRSSTASKLKAVESSSQQTKTSLSAEVASVKALVGTVTSEPRVGVAEFSQLQVQVEATVQGLASSTEAFEELKDNDFKQLQDSIDELRLASQKMEDTSATLMETHQRVAAVEAKLEDVRNEVQIMTAEAMDGVAKLADLEEMGKELDTKATGLEIKQLAQQQAALAQSVNGMAEWLAVRTDAPEGGKQASTGQAPSLTKFRCLTCDQEVKGQMKGNAFMKGGLLPKLDGMGAPHSLVPGGPGLHMAEMRKMTTTYPGYRGGGGQEFADYGAMEEPRMGKSTRTADGRVALQMPAGGLKMPAGPKAHVFIV